MTTKVEAPAADFSYAAYCEECAEGRGFALPFFFATGLLSVAEKQAYDMRAEIHERAHDHHILIVEYKPAQ